MKKSITVLVTAVGGGGVGEQVVKALRLAGGNYRIVGTDVTSFSKTLYRVDHPYLVPRANERGYIDALLKLCAEHKVKAVFPGSDLELQRLGQARRRFAARGVFLPINPRRVLDICSDKLKTSAWLAKNGFSHARTIPISSRKDLALAPVFPAVIKPAVGSGGSKNVFIVRNRKELAQLGGYLLSLGGSLLLQEYVGDAQSEYTVGVLVSMKGKLINSICVKRNLQTALGSRIAVPNLTPSNGLGPVLTVSSGISQGEIGRYPEITRSCEQIALRLGCRGVLNIQCRHHRGSVYVFEINPRFSGTTSFRALAGYNEPDVLVREHLSGRETKPHFPYRTGLAVRGLCESLVEESEVASVCRLSKPRAETAPGNAPDETSHGT